MIAYLNGKFLPIEEAKISVEDRGLQFGDGVYEVIKATHKGPFLLDRHIKRLKRSAEEISLSLPMGIQELKGLVEEVYIKSEETDAVIYIQLTRGQAERRHQFPESTEPTLIITVRPFRDVPTELRGKGIPAITYPDIRWGRCDIKSTNLLPNVLAKETAIKKGAFEAIFVKDNYITEGTSSNLFVFDGIALVTHPLNNEILPGITRETVIKLANNIGIDTVERRINIDELQRVEEVFITGTTVDILPIIEIDGKKIKKGTPSEVSSKLYKELMNYIEESV